MHPVVDEYDLSSLEQLVSGAAPLSAELALAEAGARVGCEIVQGYGMTGDVPASHDVPRRLQTGIGRRHRPEYGDSDRRP